MEKRLRAVYKDGVLQPLEPLPLEELQQVTVTVTDSPVIDDDSPDTSHPKNGPQPPVMR